MILVTSIMSINPSLFIANSDTCKILTTDKRDIGGLFNYFKRLIKQAEAYKCKHFAVVGSPPPPPANVDNVSTRVRLFRLKKFFA
jgi:hypothetical protein